MPLTDIFAATESEARSLRLHEQPLSRFAGADIKGVDLVKLEQLLRLAQERTFDPKLTQFPFVAELADEGPWIVRFAPALEEFLFDLDQQHIPAWGERWAQIDEFRLDGFSTSDVTEVLRTLVRVVHEARALKKPLFVWMAM